MYIIETIPIKRGPSKDTLSYFHKDPLTAGTIVSAPIRGRLINALVLKSDSISSQKMSLKESPFALKKIAKVKSGAIFSKPFIEAVNASSDIFIGSAGSVLSALSPKTILENANKVALSEIPEKKEMPGVVSEHLISQDETDERMALYKSIIREEFAKNKSVFFCLPTNVDVKKVGKILEKGIEEYSYTFHNGLKDKDILHLWNKAVKEKHPIIVISTGTFLSIPRNDLGLIIVDKESSRHYKLQTKPYIDIRKFAEIYADKIKGRVIFGDIALRVETMWRFRNNDLSNILPPKFKYLTGAEVSLVDMRTPIDEEKKDFSTLSPEIRALIETTKENNQNMFIFSARRGLSPTTVCGDCGEIVKCGNCNTPITLHKNASKKIYLCHRCNNIENPERKCLFCGSWKLVPLGIGIETIEEELKEKYPDIKIFKVDSDSKKTEKSVILEIEKWHESPGSILLGTELAIPYTSSAENVAVASIDALFSVPDFRINEKVLGIILEMRSYATRKFLVQTRNPEQSSIKAGATGNLLDFYRDEVEERKGFDFPPFFDFIKISLSGDKNTITKEMTVLQEDFKDYAIDIFPALSMNTKGKSVINALFKIKKGEWPEKTLLQKLKTLPPKFSIKFDPESFL
ncbi:MAG: hypothetical protein AAB840_02605 [Patescibacteria group bacterium]